MYLNLNLNTNNERQAQVTLTPAIMFLLDPQHKLVSSNENLCLKVCEIFTFKIARDPYLARFHWSPIRYFFIICQLKAFWMQRQ